MNGVQTCALPISYPRKYNLLINLQAARSIGVTIPPNLLGAAYRVYSDDKGTFTGPRD